MTAETAVRLLTPIIPLLFLGALLSVPAFYVRYRNAPSPKQELSLLRYVGIVAAIGALSFVAGTMLGIGVACSKPAAGNLCGLAGVFGTGPLASAAGIILSARRATRNAMQAP